MKNQGASAFRICQSTTQMFRDLYIQNTMLVLVQAGSKRLYISDSESFTVEPGQLLIFPSGTFITIENRTLSGAEYTADCLSYSDDMINSVYPEPRSASGESSAIHVKDCPLGLSDLIKNSYLKTLDSNEPDELVLHRAVEPLIWLKSLGVKLSTIQEKPLDCRLRDMIATDVLKKWRISDVVTELSCSEATLRRRLKERGTSFSNILMDVRLEQGLTRLQTTQQPISQIALDCGFSTPSHFTDAFKTRFSASPSVVRAEKT